MTHERSHDNRPWVEKYRPQKLDDIAGHGDIVSSVRRMMETGDLTHLLLYGPPGTGKTSTVLALCKGCEILELNASDDRGIETIRCQVKEFVSTRKLTTFFLQSKVSTALKLVVLDECDALTLPAQMALRRIIEQYSTGARFCLIANHINKLIPAILSRCTRFRFSPIPNSFVAEKVQSIANAENLHLDKDAVLAIVDIAAGDLRKAINILQSLQIQKPKQVAVESLQIQKPNQVADVKVETVRAEQVYKATGRCLPADLSKLFNILRSENYDTAFAATKKMVMVDGFSVADLVKGLHMLILVDTELDSKCFASLIVDLAETEKRVSTGASELIQLAALVSTFQINRSPKKQIN